MPMLTTQQDESLDYAKYPTLFAAVPSGVHPLAAPAAADSCSAMLLAELEKPEREQALALLATAYSWGLGLPEDEDKAFHYWQLAAEHGLGMGQYMLACMLMSEGKPEEAEKWFMRAYNNRIVSPHIGSAEPQPAPPAEQCRTCGDHLKYSIDAANTLTISGTGSTYDFTGTKTPPWKGRPIRRVILEEGVEYIGVQAFAGCKELESIKLPGTLKSMAEDCLDGTAIRKLYIPDSVQTICNLGDLPALTEVSISPSVLSFLFLAYSLPRKNAIIDVHFRGDPPIFFAPKALGPNMVRAHYPASNSKWKQEILRQFQGNITWFAEKDLLIPSAPWQESTAAKKEPHKKPENKVTCSMDSQGRLHISGSGSIVGWTNDGEIVRAPWRTQGKYAAAKSIIIGEGITELGLQAFTGCEALESIELPSTLESMRLDCFDRTNIKELYIPDGVRKIQNMGWMPALTKISLPSGVTLTTLQSGGFSKTTDVYFRGDPPAGPAKISLGNGKVKAHYPVLNLKWTAAKRKQFDGNITWIPER